MVIVRENTEDLYCGEPERWIDADTCEATKVLIVFMMPFMSLVNVGTLCVFVFTPD